MKIPTLALLAFIAAAATQAEDWGDATDEISSSPGFEESKAICRSLKGREAPAADRPDFRTAASLKGCNSEALYYGIGMKADPVRARQCAFLELEGEELVFGGRTMLMTIYANGVGAQRDFDLATRFACEIGGAPFESHGRVMHLAELKAQNWQGRDFHFCDDITSGLAMGYCAAHDATIAGARRDAATARLIAGWTAAERRAFRPLQQAHEAFVLAHGGGEVDLSGTARGALQTGAEEKLRDELLDMLRSLAAGRAPRYSAAQFRAADARLNADYRRLLGETVSSDNPGAVTREGIRDAQRAWLRYRDAFLTFARIKFPQYRSDGLAAWLTEKRTAMWREGD